MHFKIRSIFVSIFLFFVFISNAQNGLNFQGVARNTNNVILASQPISLRLSIIKTSVNGTTEYAEVRKVTTNAQGLFSVVIGDTGAISSLGNFATIDWKLAPKFLKIEMDVAAGNNFVLIGTTQFQSVAYAQFAQSVDAEKLNGIVPVEKGGTGTTSLAAFKTALSIDKNTVGLSNVNNTADTAKPISNATILELDKKVSNSTFTSSLAQKVDTSFLAQLAPIASPTFTGTVRGITKAMVGLGNIDNTADTEKPISNATKILLDTKVSTETFSNTVLTKENAANKSTATNLGAAAASDILFPTQKAVKTYVDAQSNAGGVADGGITTIKLAALAVTNAKLASGIDKAKVGLENVDNTSDAEKPISTATQLALDTKKSAAEFDFSLRNLAKLDETNHFAGENIFNGILTLPNGILNLAAGTQIQSGAESPTVIQNRLNADFSIKTSKSFQDNEPDEHEFKFTADGRLFFPDGGSRILIDESEIDDQNVLSIRSKTGSYIELKTTSDEIGYFWTFKDDGTIIFPNSTKIEAGTATETIIRNSLNSDFLIISADDYDQYKLKFTSAGSLEIDNKFRISNSGEINMIGQRQTNATIGIINLPCDDCPDILNINHDEYINIGNPMDISWTFNKLESQMRFPNRSLISDSYEGGFEIFASGGFIDEEEEIKNGIKIFDKEVIISSYSDNEDSYKYWNFNKEGILTFPDGTIVSGNISSTAYNYPVVGFGFESINNKPFIIQTSIDNDIYQWMFDASGNIQFPGTLTALGNTPDGFGFSLGDRNFAIYSSSENGGGLLTFKTDGTLNLSYAEAGISPQTIITNVSMGVISNTSFNIDYPGQISFANEAGRLTIEENGSITFPDLTVASGNISNTGNFGFDTSPTNSGFSIITAGTSTGTTQLWTFGTNGVLNLPTGGDIKIGGTSVLSGTSNLQTVEFYVDGQSGTSQFGEDITNPSINYLSSINNRNEDSWLFPIDHTPNSFDNIKIFIEGKRIPQKNTSGLPLYQIANHGIHILWERFNLISYDFNGDYTYHINIEYQY